MRRLKMVTREKRWVAVPARASLLREVVMPATETLDAMRVYMLASPNGPLVQYTHRCAARGCPPANCAIR